MAGGPCGRDAAVVEEAGQEEVLRVPLREAQDGRRGVGDEGHPLAVEDDLHADEVERVGEGEDDLVQVDGRGHDHPQSRVVRLTYQ